VTLSLAFWAALLEPHEVGEFPDAIFTISHGRPQVGSRCARRCACE
jgi:hypothetical protein